MENIEITSYRMDLAIKRYIIYFIEEAEMSLKNAYIKIAVLYIVDS